MIRNISFVLLAAIVLVACTKNAITGRRQNTIIPESELQSMAVQQYQQFLTQNRVVSPSADRDAEMVRRVGQRLAGAVAQYLRSKGLAKDLEGYKWEYNLVESKESNAWCMPGGKIVVYTGLLPYTQNEAALAIVMGHEIAHAMLKHGVERMSNALLQQGVGVALSVAVSSKPAESQNAFLQAYGVGSTVLGTLPFSRKAESEADHYGLLWAAMAGYNPREAVSFWQRMSQSGAQKPPEFLSDHPSDERRIQQIQAWMPEALAVYKPMGK